MKRPYFPLFERFFRNSVIYIFIAFGAAVLLMQLNPFVSVPARDSGFFAYAGQQVLAGKVMYVDFWDSKGPMIFWINALGLWVGNGSFWGIWFIEYMFITISGILLAIKIQWRTSLSIILGLIFGGFLLSSTISGGNLTEDYGLLISTLAILLYVVYSKNKSKEFLIGPLLGCLFTVNFLTRLNNTGSILSILVVIFLTLIFSTKQFSKAVQLAVGVQIGFLLSSLLASVYFLLNHNFTQMIEASIFYNLFYASSNTDIYSNFLVLLNLNPVFWGLVLVIFLFGLSLWFREKTDPLLNYALIDLPFEFILSTLLGKGYIHYFTNLSLPIIILMAVVIDRIFGRFVDIKNFNKLEIVFLITLLAVFISKFGFAVFQNYSEPLIAFAQGDVESTFKHHPYYNYVMGHTKEDDYVLVWNIDPVLNFQTRRLHPLSVPFYPWLVESKITSKLEKKVQDDLFSRRPKLIFVNKKMVNENLDLDPETVRKNQINKLFIPDNLNDIIEWVGKNYVVSQFNEKTDVYIINPVLE